MSHTESETYDSSDSSNDYDNNKPDVIPEEQIKDKCIRIPANLSNAKKFSYAAAVRQLNENSSNIKEVKTEESNVAPHQIETNKKDVATVEATASSKRKRKRTKKKNKKAADVNEKKDDESMYNI